MDADKLSNLDLFEGLSPEEVERCAEMFKEKEILQGSGLTREDDYSYKFFVILEGRVKVLRGWQPVAMLGPGEFFGEMGVMSGEKRNARVVADTRCTVAESITWDFRQIAQDYPTLAGKIEAVIEERKLS